MTHIKKSRSNIGDNSNSLVPFSADDPLMAIDSSTVDERSHLTLTNWVKKILLIEPEDVVAFYHDGIKDDIILKVRRGDSILASWRIARCDSISENKAWLANDPARLRSERQQVQKKPNSIAKSDVVSRAITSTMHLCCSYQMKNLLEQRSRKRAPYSSSSILYTITVVMQSLQNKKMSRKEIINDMLNGDSQLFDMVSLFLYSNKWLTRENTMTEKGKVWLEMVNERKEEEKRLSGVKQS